MRIQILSMQKGPHVVYHNVYCLIKTMDAFMCKYYFNVAAAKGGATLNDSKLPLATLNQRFPTLFLLVME